MKFLAACSLVALLAVSACTGSDAVDQSAGGQYRFHLANPSGKTIPAAERKKVADFTGTLLDGARYRLRQDAGKVVVLNFWASWCAPCQVESPQFDILYRKNKSAGVAFVGIDTKDIKSQASSFVRDHAISFPNVYDEPGEVALRLGHLPAQSLPFTVVIDKQQRVAAVYLGKQTAQDLQPVLTRLAAEPLR
jgi:peroxiredoxin